MRLVGGVSTVRVALRLSPPLVADLLAMLVDAPGVDVIVDASDGNIQVVADILVTSEPLAGLPPRALVLLEQVIAPGLATILTDGATTQVEVADLDAIASLVRELCATAT